MNTTYPNGIYSDTMVRGASGLNIILGIWLIISPWVLGYSGLSWPLWNNVACGILIALLAAARIWSPGTGPGVSWVIALLGIWLIVASFIWAYGPAAAVPPAATGAATPAAPAMAPMVQGALNAHWNDIVVGAIVLILGAWSAMSGRTEPTTAAH